MATAATDFEIIDFGTARNLSKSSRPPRFETRGIDWFQNGIILFCGFETGSDWFLGALAPPRTNLNRCFHKQNNMIPGGRRANYGEASG